MVTDNQYEEEAELESLHSNKSFLLGDEEEEQQYPYRVIFQDHEVVIGSSNIKESKVLKFQYVVLSLSFLVLGLSDSTIGTVMPSLLEEYGIDHSEASYLFSSQFVGYLVSSLSSNFIITKYGFYGAMIFCELSSAICFFIISWRPPFAVIVLSYILNGFGAGILDSAGNLWIGKLVYSNQLLGLLHADYGFGGMISPVLITKMVNSGINWSNYYLLLSGLCFFTLIGIAIFFREETSWKYKYVQSQRHNGEMQEDVQISEVITNKLVWFFSFVLFVYVGGELAIGSWIYNYLIVIKEQTTTSSSYITSAYWLFLTLGRIVLGFVIGHWFNTRELTAVVICCSIITTCSLVFTIFYKVLLIQVLAIVILGFFIGPTFPSIVVVAMKYLPLRIETAGVGMLVAMGGGGAAVIPYLIGLVSKVKPNGGGLIWFPFITLIIFGIDALLFFLFYLKKRGTD